MRRGVTLAETLVTLFLLGLVLSVTGDLMSRGRSLSRFYQQKSDLQRGSWALQRLSVQLLGATKMLAPLQDASSDRLQWLRVRPDSGTRLPTTLGSMPAPVPAPNPVWDPSAAVWNEQVSVYRLVSGDLVWFGASSEVLLCSRLSQFECRSQGRLLELSAEVPVRDQRQTVRVRHLLEAGVSW